MIFSQIVATNLEGQDKVSTPKTMKKIYLEAHAEKDRFNNQLREYLHVLEKARQFADENYTDNAKALLAILKAKYPNYPEVYVALGDLFKIDDRKLAIEYYSKAVELCPFDYFTQTKLALMGKRPLKESFKNEEYFKRKQDNFVMKHQQALRVQLTVLGKMDPTQLDLFAASKDAFYGLTAKVNKLIPLAQYYFSKAIVQFNHDYLAKTEYALIHNELNNHNDSITQLTQIAEEYHYTGAYLYLYKIYHSLKNYGLARRNLVNSLSIAQRDELDELIDSRELMTEFLQYNVFDELQVKKYSLPKRYDLKAVMDSPTRLGISFHALLKQLLTVDNPIILEELNLKILEYPRVAALYKARAKYYQHKGIISEAVLDHTMALWHSPKEECIDYYLERYTAHLGYGNAIQAEFDFIHIKKIAEETFDLSKANLIAGLSKDASSACYQVGNEYLTKKKFQVAENIFRLGIKIKPTLNMYLDCSKAMKRGGKSSAEIVDLLHDALEKMHLKSSELNKLNSVYRHFLNLEEKEIIERVNFFDNHDEPNSGDPSKLALPQDSNVDITFIVINIAILTVTVIFALFIFKRYLRSLPASRALLEKKETTPAKNYPLKKKATKPKAQASAPSFSPKKTNTTSHIKSLLSVNENVEINGSEEDKAEKKHQDKILQDKKQAKKLKEKEKKHELRSQRKSGRLACAFVSSESEESESKDASDKPAIPVSTDKDKLQVELNDFENKIFSLLYSSVPEAEREKYKTYLVGGWAYDKVRQKVLGIAPCAYNDADFTTEIPPEMLLKNFDPIAEVPGLFFSKLDNIKIDVMHEPDLSYLLRDAKNRDFLTLYINAEGKVSDPTGFALINLQSKHLSGVNAPADIFKEDPLVILRAIYLATKRDLKINSLIKIIKRDRHLLIPRVTNSTLREERLLTPRRFNLRFAKLFTQHLASKNLILLKNLGILEVLFPDIYPELQVNFNWLAKQIEVTSAYVWPKISIIYANFIVSAVVLRVPASELTYLPAQLFPSMLQTAIHDIWSASLLFQDTFTDPDNLYSFLKRPLQEWKSYIEPILQSSTSVSMSYR